MKKILWGLTALLMVALCACSDDEPAVDTSSNDDASEASSLPSLQQMCGENIWRAQSISIVASNGQRFSTDDLYNLAGAYCFLSFSVEGDTFTEYIETINNTGSFYKVVSNYTFDSKTGEIFLNKSEAPFAKIVNYDSEKPSLTVHYKFDSFVYKGMLTGEDPDDYTPDKGCYVEAVLTPCTDAVIIKSLSELETRDLRK